MLLPHLDPTDIVLLVEPIVERMRLCAGAAESIHMSLADAQTLANPVLAPAYQPSLTTEEIDMSQRDVILGMNVTMDGYVARSGGELDWLWATLDPAQGERATGFLRTVDTILIGHHTYPEQAAHWPSQSGEMADLLNAHTKIVFADSPVSLDWNNSRLATADPATEITKLKQEPGKHIFVTGGATLAQSLTREGLIDEYRITVHPVVLGAGKRLFADVSDITRFTLLDTTTYTSGAVELHYRRI